MDGGKHSGGTKRHSTHGRYRDLNELILLKLLW
jgi:hypothetical protein